MLEKFLLWCCDKRPARTSHILLRHAENVPFVQKPHALSEYILMHFQPPTQAHKAIKPAIDKRTCRKVIKCKVLWRTAELRGLLQGHALIYCLTGWWAGEAGGYWPPSVREITAFSWKQPLYEWDIWQKGEWTQILPELQIAWEIQCMKMSKRQDRVWSEGCALCLSIELIGKKQPLPLLTIKSTLKVKKKKKPSGALFLKSFK